MNEEFSPRASPPPEEKALTANTDEQRSVEKAEKEAGGASGSSGSLTREELKVKLETLYTTLDTAREKSKGQTTPQARETEKVIREIDIQFNEFVDAYRVRNKVVPAFDEAQAIVFNNRLDQFIVNLSVVQETKAVSEKEGTDKQQKPKIVSLGLFQGNEALVQAAIEKSGEEAIRMVCANIDLTSRVPASIHQEIFGRPPAQMGNGVESTKIAILLANGTLENSPYAYLLQDPAVMIRGARDAARNRSVRVQDDINALRGREENQMRQLTEETKDGTYNLLDLFTSKIDSAEKGIQLSVDEVKSLRSKIQERTSELQVVENITTTLNIALEVGAAEGDRLSGRIDAADRRMTQLLEKYGENLQSIDAPLAKRAMESAVRLRDQKKLSSVEELLLFSNPRSSEALKKAIEQKIGESSAIDVLDQVRSKQTFRAGSFEKYSPTQLDYKGRDVSRAMGIGERTTLRYTNGRTLQVIVTSEARRVLESIPQGREPVLLRPISSMQIDGGVGRGNKSYLRTAPADCIVQHTDIGFVDVSGNVVRDDGKTTFDVSQNENRATIEKQIRNQKGFRVEVYKPSFPLRGMDNKRYPYALRTITTQSGIRVEGVTVSKDADDLFNAEPPAGETLVLMRIPKAISLRAPDSNKYEDGSNQHQKVLTVDMVSKEDLAYAKIDGNTLTSREISTGKETKNSVTEADKEQEEKTSDIQRVLDRNPAINSVKRSASTIQQTVGNLQKFLEAGKAGSARKAFVEFARSEAKPTLEILKNPQLRQDVEEAKAALRALKGVNGVALGGLEKKIDEQLKALDGFTAMLTDGRTTNLLETIMDASKFDADSWANFFTNQLPVIIASIAFACAAAALVVATCGTAAPFIAIAAATAFGGVVGAELGKEAVYAGRQLLDSRVKSGDATFSGRSKTGAYIEGQKTFNEKTGKYENLEFFRDVANPLAREFAIGFATTLATMGIGNVVGGQLSKLLQKSEIVDRITARSGILQSLARKLASLNENKELLERATGLKDAITRALKSLPKEIGEELGEEAEEGILEKFLNQIDISLSGADAADGKLGLGTVAGVLLAIAKSTRIGKSTISYDVRGKGPQELMARSQAIRAEAESNGAIVTDLGKGVLSIRYPVEVNGKVEFEKVQMQPNVLDGDVAVEAIGGGTDTDVKKKVETQRIEKKGVADSSSTQESGGDGRSALLEYVKKNDVKDPERLKIAGDLLGIDLDLPENKKKHDAILAAHEYGKGNLEKGYSANEITEKGKILMRSGLTRVEAQLLLDTGVCGTAIETETKTSSDSEKGVTRSDEGGPSGPDTTVGNTSMDMKRVESGTSKPIDSADNFNQEIERNTLRTLRENGFRNEMDALQLQGKDAFRNEVMKPENLEQYNENELMDISNRLRLNGEGQAQVDLYETAVDPAFKQNGRVREFYALALIKVGRSRDAINVCKKLITDEGKDNSLVRGIIGDATTDLAMSAEKLQEELEKGGESNRPELKESIQKFKRNFGEDASVELADVRSKRETMFKEATDAYEQGFREQPNAFSATGLLRRLGDRKADITKEQAQLMELGKKGPLSPEQTQKLQDLKNELSSIETKIVGYQKLNALRFIDEGGNDSLEYWTHSSRIENELIGGKSAADVDHLLAYAYTTVDATWKIDNTCNRLNRVEQKSVEELNARKQMGEEGPEIAALEAKIAAVGKVKQKLIDMKPDIEEKILLEKKEKIDNAAKKEDAKMTPQEKTRLQELRNQYTTSSRERFLDKTCDIRGLSQSVVPTYREGGVKRGGRVPDILVNRQDRANIRAIVDRLGLSSEIDPLKAIAEIGDFTRTILNTEAVQDLHSVDHETFDRTSDAALGLAGVDPSGQRDKTRTVTNISAAIESGVADCREVAYTKALLFEAYKQVRIEALNLQAQDALAKNDTKTFNACTEQIAEIQRFQLRVADVGVFSGVEVADVYAPRRTSMLDPTAVQRVYKQGEQLSKYEQKKSTLAVRYKQGSKNYNNGESVLLPPSETRGNPPVIDNPNDIESIELRSNAEQHTLTFLYIEGKNGEPSTTQFADSFYDESKNDPSKPKSRQSPYSFSKGELGSADREGFIRTPDQEIAKIDEKGNIIYENGKPVMIKVPVYIQFLRYSRTGYSNSLGEADNNGTGRHYGREVAIDPDPEKFAQAIVDHAKDSSKQLPLRENVKKARESNESKPVRLIEYDREQSLVVSDDQADPANAMEARKNASVQYERNPIVQQVKTELRSLISSNFDAATATELSELVDHTLPLYANTDQYHSGEHMLTMTRDIITLAEKGGLSPETFRAALKRSIIAGQYHDTGNGRNPDITPGVDEGAAVRVFLRDVAMARELKASGQPLGMLSALGNLSDTDVQQVVGSIVGTVFADRVSDADGIGKQKYCADAANALSKLGIRTETQELAVLAVNAEATVVKNADIVSSLKTENVVRNGLTNFSEDTRKDIDFLLSDDPLMQNKSMQALKSYYLTEISAGREINPKEFRRLIDEAQRLDPKGFPGFKMPNIGKSATEYRSGFQSFLAGNFRRQRGPDGALTDTEQYRDAREGPLLGTPEMKQYGKEVKADSDKAFAEAIRNDGPLLNAIQDIISADALGNPQENTIGKPLSRLAAVLRKPEFMGAEAFAPYEQVFKKYGDKTIATMSADQINEVFTARTQQVILIENAKTSSDGRAAMLEYMKTTDVGDTERLKIASELLGMPGLKLDEGLGKAIMDAHTFAKDRGNLSDGYSSREITAKGVNLMRSGLTRAQAQLLLDTGVCGTVNPAIPPPPPPAPRKSPSTEKGLSQPSQQTIVTPAATPTLRSSAAQQNRPNTLPPPPKIPQTSSDPSKLPGFKVEKAPPPPPSTKPQNQAPLAPTPQLIRPQSQLAPKVQPTIRSANPDANPQGPASDAKAVVQELQSKAKQRASRLESIDPERIGLSRQANALRNERTQFEEKVGLFRKYAGEIAALDAKITTLDKRIGELRREKTDLMDQQRIGTILEEYHTLTQNPAALAKWTEKYGHVTPEQAKMDPYLQQKLAELRSASAFTFSSYGHAENILDGAGLVAFDPAAFKEKTLNMIPTIVDGNLAPGASEGLDLTSSREHLILSPECTRKTVSKERYTLTYVYGGQTAQYGGAQPQYNKIQDPRRAGVDAREQSAGYKPLLQAMTHDQKMTSIMEHTNVDLGDRPNNLTVSVTMDKEQAMEMQQYFLQHPEMIRPFFLNGMQGLEFTHKPPPYEKTDAMPNPGIRSREFGTTVVEKDYVRRLQLRGERILQ